MKKKRGPKTCAEELGSRRAPQPSAFLFFQDLAVLEITAMLPCESLDAHCGHRMAQLAEDMIGSDMIRCECKNIEIHGNHHHATTHTQFCERPNDEAPLQKQNEFSTPGICFVLITSEPEICAIVPLVINFAPTRFIFVVCPIHS